MLFDIFGVEDYSLFLWMGAWDLDMEKSELSGLTELSKESELYKESEKTE